MTVPPQTTTRGAGPSASTDTAVAPPARPSRVRRALTAWRTSSPSLKRWSLAFFLLAAVCLLGPLVAPHPPNTGVGLPLEAPSGSYLLGSDADGRDVLSRLLFASRISLGIALFSVALGAVVGTTMGLVVAAMEGHLVSTLLLRFMDAILAFPFVVLAAVTASVTFGQSVGVGPIRFGELSILAAVLALIQIPIFGRLARGTALEENSRDYVSAARACGQTQGRILRTELFPNIMPALVVQTSFSVVIAIAAEAAISYLGLGIQKPNPSWGNMIRDGLDAIVLGAWWIAAFPTAVVIAVSIVLTGLGEALRVAMDPRNRTRHSVETVSAEAEKKET
ncbi:ABC transporter permease [Nocardioides sp. W7]|uniref:ABC transporter permease n=1 Tax=Nocardioides sp. W7 TaxID=2931390 RepID=UPI001FD3728A|nr:ABC transporter permease [Nocardioides sp. W7]